MNLEDKKKGTHTPKRVSIYFVLILIYLGCVDSPFKNMVINQPQPGLVKKIDKNVWLSSVTIYDALEWEKTILQNGLSLNIAEYLRSAHYFKSVNLLPGKLKPDDLVFFFSFNKYRCGTRISKKGLALCIITVDLFLLFGGDFYEYYLDYECELKVYDASRQLIYNKTANVDLERKLNAYSDNSHYLLDPKARTRLITVLVEEFIRQYPKLNGKKK